MLFCPSLLRFLSLVLEQRNEYIITLSTNLSKGGLEKEARSTPFRAFQLGPCRTLGEKVVLSPGDEGVNPTHATVFGLRC